MLTDYPYDHELIIKHMKDKLKYSINKLTTFNNGSQSDKFLMTIRIFHIVEEQLKKLRDSIPLDQCNNVLIDIRSEYAQFRLLCSNIQKETYQYGILLMKIALTNAYNSLNTRQSINSLPLQNKLGSILMVNITMKTKFNLVIEALPQNMASDMLKDVKGELDRFINKSNELWEYYQSIFNNYSFVEWNEHFVTSG